MRRSPITIAASLFLIVCGVSATGEDRYDPERSLTSLKVICDQAMTCFADEDTAGAIKIVRPHWKLPEEELDQLDTAIDSLRKRMAERMGKSVGFEYVGHEKAGSSFVRLNYLLKHERHAYVVTFRYYRAQDRWEMNEINMNTDVSPLFDDD